MKVDATMQCMTTSVQHIWERHWKGWLKSKT